MEDIELVIQQVKRDLDLYYLTNPIPSSIKDLSFLLEIINKFDGIKD